MVKKSARCTRRVHKAEFTARMALAAAREDKTLAELPKHWDGAAQHTSRLVREYLDSTGGAIQMALLPSYSPDLNPVEYLWAWFKRHALANFCPRSLAELKATARSKLRSGQRRQSIIIACWKQAELW